MLTLIFLKRDFCIAYFPTLSPVLFLLFLFVLMRLSIAVAKHHDHKQFGEGRVYFILQLSGNFPSLREVRVEIQERKKMKAGTKAEALEEPFTNSSTSLCLLSYTSQDQLPRGGTTHRAIQALPTLPHQLMKKHLPDMSTGRSAEHFLGCDSLFSDTSSFRQVGQRNNQDGFYVLFNQNPVL